MNNSMVKAIKQYLKNKGVDVNTPEGRRIYKHVKRKLTNNKAEIEMASKKEDKVSR